jgi:hypothetical protein
MITRRSTFTLLLYSLNHESIQRIIAGMRAIHEHKGRAWLILDAPVPNMPPRIIGAQP